MSDLRSRGVKAAKWNYIGNIVRMAIQFGIGILLSRLIGPSEFGLVAIALLMVGFGQIFVDFGINSAIIQSRELDKRDVDSLGTLQILIGAAMTGAAMLIAGPMAHFFHQPGATAVIRWMSLIFVLRAIGQTSYALLSRDLKFREIQIASMSGYVVGYVVIGAPMAFLGYGAWSVVCAQIGQVTLNSAINLIQTRGFHTLTLKGLRADRLKFGRLVLSANLSSWALFNADNMLVGHVLGSTSLALYNRSALLANAAPQAALTGLQGVLFSVSARAQDNPEGCRKAFYTCYAMMLFTMAPLLLSVSALSRTVLEALYGQKWLAAAEILPPLCLVWIVGALSGLLGPVLMGLGRTEVETRAQWFTVLVMVPTVYGFAHISVVAAAWSVLGISILRLALLFLGAHKVLHFDLKTVAGATLLYSGIACGTAVSGLAADRLLDHAGVLVRLISDMAACGAGLLLCVVLMRRRLLEGPLGTTLLQSNMLPPKIRSCLTSLCAI